VTRQEILTKIYT